MSRSDLPRFDYNTPIGVRRSARLATAKVHHSQDSAEKDAPARDLSRKRKLDQLDPGTSSVSLVHDAGEELCSKCQQIDFEAAFQIPYFRSETYGVVVAELGRKGIGWREAACAMCRLFAAVRVQPAGRPTTDSSEYHLRALPFLRATGDMSSDDSLPEHLKKADPTCFLVLSGKGRSLQMPPLRQQLLHDLESPSHGQQLTDLIYHDSQSFGVICPVVSSATETPPRVGARRLLPDRIDYHLLRNWYGFCAQNHHLGCAISSREYPKKLKVIDCRTRRIISALPNCPYVALSYVWGKQQSAAVSSSTSSGKNTGHRTLSSTTVPSVISDAMIVTLELGWRYLWVDRYCIDQNDEEKHFQIIQMDKVYLCAVITIIAAAGESANYGLPGVSNTLRRAQPYAMVRGRLLASTMRNSHMAIGSSRWATRGWTYQEAALSRRRLVFTDDQVFFECKSMSCSESHSVPLALLHGMGSSMKRGFFETYKNKDYGNSVFRYWNEVERFTARELSYEKDSLNAFWGVANYYKKRQDSQSYPIYTHIGLPLDKPKVDKPSGAKGPYYYGPGFLLSLLWHHSGNQVPPKRRRGLPSYSWAGWEGVAHFPVNFMLSKSMVRIVRDPGTDPELSTSLGTTLDLEANTVQGQIEISENHDSRGLHTSFSLTNWDKNGQETLESQDIVLPFDFLSRHKLSSGQTFFVDCMILNYRAEPQYATYVEEPRFGDVYLMLIEYRGAIAERIGAADCYYLSEEQLRTLPKTRRIIRLG